MSKKTTKERAAFDIHASHKFLSNYCFDELVDGKTEAHEKCPEDFICDCIRHTDRVNGVKRDTVAL